MGIDFCFRKVEDIPEFFFKEEDFFYWGALVDVDHFGDEEVFCFSPPILMFEQTPFHRSEFILVKSPAFSIDGFTKLDQCVFQVVPAALHNMEVIVLKESLRPDLSGDFGEGGL